MKNPRKPKILHHSVDSSLYCNMKKMEIPVISNNFKKRACSRFRKFFRSEIQFNEWATVYSCCSMLIAHGTKLFSEYATDENGDGVILFTISYHGKTYYVAKKLHHFRKDHPDYYSLDGLCFAEPIVEIIE